MKYLLYTCMGTVTQFFCALGLALCLVPGLCDLLGTGMHHCLTRLMRSSSWRATPHTFFQTAGRPRPKSRGSSHVRSELLFMWAVCAILHCLPQAAVAAKVAIVSTPVAGAASTGSIQVIHPEAKPGGVFHTIYRQTIPYARKRAFRRAAHRATMHGHTQYRGQQLTLQQLLGSRNAQGLRCRLSQRNGLLWQLDLKLPTLVSCVGMWVVYQTASWMNCRHGWPNLSILIFRSLCFRKRTGDSMENGRTHPGGGGHTCPTAAQYSCMWWRHECAAHAATRPGG